MTDVSYDDQYEECFGCGQRHPFGLRMTFLQTGPNEIESHYVAHATHAGAPGVVHGGLQATLLDEVAGFACHTLDETAAESQWVTAELSLRYRRPVPTDVPLVVHAKVVKHEGADAHVEAEIILPDGTEATRATTRWKRLA